MQSPPSVRLSVRFFPLYRENRLTLTCTLNFCMWVGHNHSSQRTESHGQGRGSNAVGPTSIEVSFSSSTMNIQQISDIMVSQISVLTFKQFKCIAISHCLGCNLWLIVVVFCSAYIFHAASLSSWRLVSLSRPWGWGCKNGFTPLHILSQWKYSLLAY